MSGINHAIPKPERFHPACFCCICVDLALVSCNGLCVGTRKNSKNVREREIILAIIARLWNRPCSRIRFFAGARVCHATLPRCGRNVAAFECACKILRDPRLLPEVEATDPMRGDVEWQSLNLCALILNLPPSAFLLDERNRFAKPAR